MIRHLTGLDGGKALCRHAGTTQNTPLLKKGRGGDDDDHVHAPLAVCLKQQRDIENDHRPAAVTAQKRCARPGNGGMHDPLQGPHFLRLADHPGTKHPAIDASSAGRAGKARFDRAEQGATRSLQMMDCGIGIEHRHARCAKHGGCGRFAHAD
ncbi:hypothetical protein M2334_000131 [Sphingobium sp. B11D3D]|nr:hypothetical protein [Sphingobium sp. B11D3D]